MLLLAVYLTYYVCLCFSVVGEGRTEPVGIELKSNRSGLGQEAEKRKRDEQRRLDTERRYEKRIKAAQALQNSYRDTKISEQKQRRLEKHLRESQKVCEQLDTSHVSAYNTTSIFVMRVFTSSLLFQV